MKRKVLKLILIAVMLVGIILSIFNFTSIESQARPKGVEGTTVENGDGTTDCQGAPLDC